MFRSDTIQTYNVLECCQHSCEASAICYLLVYSTLSLLSYPWALHPSCSPSCCLNKLIYCCFFPFSSPPTFVQRTHTHIHLSIFPKKSSHPSKPKLKLASLLKMCESHSIVSDSCDPMDYTVHGILQARVLEWVAASPGDLPNPGIKPRSPALQEDSLPAEPGGKSKNAGVGSRSLLQGIFPTQEPGSPALQVDSLPTYLPPNMPNHFNLSHLWVFYIKLPVAFIWLMMVTAL